MLGADGVLYNYQSAINNFTNGAINKNELYKNQIWYNSFLFIKYKSIKFILNNNPLPKSIIVLTENLV